MNITMRWDIPDQPDQWLEFRKLSWKQMKDARDARQVAVLEKAKGFMEFLPPRCSRCGGDKHEGPCPPPCPRCEQRAHEGPCPVPDPTNEFDQATILHAGIVAWSYDMPVSDKAIDDELDEPAADGAFSAIVAYNTVPKGEAQEK